MNSIFFQTGMNAIEVVKKIVELNPTIDGLTFNAYKPEENVSEMTERPSISRLISNDTSDGEEIRMGREEMMATSRIYEIIDALREGFALKVLSKVVLKRSIVHIPLMDFSCRDFSGNETELPQNRADIEYFLREAGYDEGVILFSGRSFHYYGTRLMNVEEWRVFMANCLLSEITDKRYIGHRLKDGWGTMRLSACPPLHPHLPKVVSVLSQQC